MLPLIQNLSLISNKKTLAFARVFTAANRNRTGTGV